MAENQFSLYQAHKQRYFDPEIAKLQTLDEKILKDMEAESQKRASRELGLLKNRKEVRFAAKPGKRFG